MSGEPKDESGMPDSFTGVLEQMQQSWNASLGMWSALTNTWQAMLQNRGIPAIQAMVNQITNPEAWSNSFAPLAQELEDILALPHFADLPALSPGDLPSLGPAVELVSVMQQYMLATAPVWVQACHRFQTEMAERRIHGGGALDSAGEAMDVWNNVLDQTLMEFNRSPEFAKVQRRFLQAAMRHRQEVRKLGELLAQSASMPTRTEMEDVYRRLHDLNREVHSLRREVRRIKDGAPALPEPAESPATKRSRR